MSFPVRLRALALLAFVVTLLGACADSDTSGGSRGLGLNVQLAWQVARTTSGHKLHVGKKHVACAQCHELDGERVGKASPARCATCHERESSIHHAEVGAAQRFGAGAKSDCTTCHAFSHTAPNAGTTAEFSPTDCARCHAVRQGATPAVVVHGSSDCVSCHRPHDDATPKPGPCAGCHTSLSTRHAALGKSAELVCTTCHQHQHAPASEALATCQTCHASERPLVPRTALFATGHRECVGCHQPHAFDKSAARPCRSCHADVRVLAAARVPAHDECTSCHAPHDVRATPAQACVSCHAEVHPEHPKLGAAAGCTGCHDPHPTSPRRQETARSCSGCHQTAHADNEFHGGVACLQCHKPHAFALGKSERSLCSGCHAAELSRVAARSGHQDCAGCHRGLPHRPATLLASCGTCHATETHEARPGHQQCTNCHDPHSGAKAAPCKSCHQEVAHSAPLGHADCVKCHQPHSGNLAVSLALSGCSTCHAAEASSKHGQIAKDCGSCHRPHGPTGPTSPPSCASCHAASSLPGLHQVGKHQDCSRCHSGHGDRPRLAREICLTCHADRKSHFIDAPRCASCHLFDTHARP